MTTTQSTNIAIAQSVYAAFARGDIPTVLAVMEPDVTWVGAAGGPYGGTFVGPQAVVEGVFARLGAEWRSFAVTPQEYLESGDTVLVLGWYDATHGTSGKTMRSRFVHVIRVSDGRMAAFEQVADTRLFWDAMT